MSPLWLLALIPFVAGLALATSQIRQLVTETLRRSTGTVVEATVTGHTASHEATYPTLHPVVTFPAPDGTASQRALPDEAGPHVLPEGSRVRVRFDPAHPDLTALDNDSRYRSCVTWLWTGMALWAGTLAVVIWRMIGVLNESAGYASRW